MPVLQARESIMRINEFAYVLSTTGFGGLEENDARTFIRELRVQSEGKKKVKVAERPKSVEEMMGMLRMMGNRGVVS
jgi:hypothetical protein